MRIFIVFLIIVFVIAVISSSKTFPKVWKSLQASLGGALVIPGETPPTEPSQKESQKAEPAAYYSPSPTPSTSPSSAPAKSQPTASINTSITSGPEEGEIIEDTNKVTFEFEEKISPKKTEERIWFETKIVGFDDDWQSTSYSKTRTAELPAGPKEYTFLVRAKTKNLTDPTPASRTFKINTSPYFGKIRISSTRAQSYYNPSLITLRTQLEKDKKINITNWRIQTRQGEFVIPQGIERYQSYVPPNDIIVKQSDTIYLIGGENPLGKAQNFRANKCFGYLSNYHKFYPSIWASCPRPKLEEFSYLAPSCQEFILHLSSCEIPDYSENLEIAHNSQCTSYLKDNFNYNSCLKNYSKDNDFLKNYWYIYLTGDMVNKLHDTVYLRDKNGLVVNKYFY